MNRAIIAKINAAFLILLLAGVCVHVGQKILRENITDYYFFGGEEDEGMGDYQLASESYRQAARLASRKGPVWLLGPPLPQRAGEAWFRLGMIQEEQIGDSEEALASYKEAARADPDGFGLKARLRVEALESRAFRIKALKEDGLKSLEMKDYLEARRSFEKAVRLDPNDGEARFFLRSAIVAAHPSVTKSQAAELVHLALVSHGIYGARLRFTPFWVHTAAKKREALILDVPTAGRRTAELLVSCAEQAALLLDYNLAFDFGRLVIRRHPGDEVRPPTFSAFKTEELHDVSERVLKSFHRGLLTPGELLHQLTIGSPL